MLKKKTQKQNSRNLSAVTDEESTHAKLKSMEKYFTTCFTNDCHNICKVLKRDCVSKNIKYNCVWYGRGFKSTSQ